MNDKNDRQARDDEPCALGPRPFLIIGASTVAVALVGIPFLKLPVRDFMAIALFGGALAAGCAVALHPTRPRVMGLAAGVAFLVSIGFDSRKTGWFPGLGWDSARLLFLILSVVAVVVALILYLPRTGRRLAVSLLILLHFGGIITAATLETPNSWLSWQAWVFFYRPYLEFMFLTDSYHFFAPEPPPTTLLWFFVEYERDADGTRNYRWVKIPDFNAAHKPIRPDGRPVSHNLEYTRHCKLAQNMIFPGPGPNDELFPALLKRRQAAGSALGIPVRGDLPVEKQYGVTRDFSKRWLRAYVRHVARTFPHPKKPDLRVASIKVYSVVHMLITPNQLANGLSPFDELLYMPYYLGEFDTAGKHKGDGAGANAGSAPDPFLNWLIPIMPPPDSDLDPADRYWLNVPRKNYLYVHVDVPADGSLP